MRHEIGDSNLRRHAHEAANSVVLNIGEGAAQLGAAKKRHYRIAYASAVEVASAYDAALDSGQRVPVEEIFDHVDHIVAVMTKLIRR
jgi:four helix bundle protein